MHNNQIILQEAKGCYNFFYDYFSRFDATYGMMPDCVPKNNHTSSIAATGFMLAGFVVAVEMGWMDKEECRQIAFKTLTTARNLPRDNGFWYHFYTIEDGSRHGRSELSTIDSALFLAGVLTVGGYLGGEVQTLANEIANEVNWRYFLDEKNKWFVMAHYDDKGFQCQWDVYGEQLIMYVLSSATNNPVSADYYYSFKRLQTDGYDFIHGWFNSLFIHQFSHAFVDFSNIVDKNGTNWFENSQKATLSAREFCVKNQQRSKSYGANSWGLTSCDTPSGYKGRIGAPPSGNDSAEHISDGTVSPCAALGSLIFTPDITIEACNHFATIDGLVGKYGFYDAFNHDENWVSHNYISIDKGITLLMVGNHHNGCVQKAFTSNTQIKQALDWLGFTKIQDARRK